MSSSRKRIADCASVGEPPKKMMRDVETIKFIIYDFKDRTEKRGKYIESPILKAHGYDWSISIYPRGDQTSSTDHEYVSCYLSVCDEGEITAKFTFRCKNRPRRWSCSQRFGDQVAKWGRGWKDFIKRDRVLEKYLEEDGSLVIEVDIQIAAENTRVWYPEELQRHNMLVELYQDASSKTSDVDFSVGETVYRVHKSILSLRAKKLYEIAMECDNNNDSPIPIHSVREEIFKSILDFLYTVEPPEIENEGIATELLVVADRYEVTHLKLYVESIIVDKFLAAGNAAELLIFADSHSCALLKEAAMNLCVTDAKTVKNAEAWSKVTESRRLVVELFDNIVCSNSNEAVDENRTNDIDPMDVTALRTKLQEANLELDGSREVLVDRLKTHNQDQDTEN